MENRGQLETELLELIEEYLKKVTPDHCDDDGIAAVSYFLLGDVAYSDNLLGYLLSSAVALAAFTNGDVLINLKKHMSSHEIDTLCDMLKRMIEFCNRVERNGHILALFDQLIWEISDTLQSRLLSIKTNIKPHKRIERLIV
jgi:hypothetical protein